MSYCVLIGMSHKLLPALCSAQRRSRQCSQNLHRPSCQLWGFFNYIRLYCIKWQPCTPGKQVHSDLVDILTVYYFSLG